MQMGRRGCISRLPSRPRKDGLMSRRFLQDCKGATAIEYGLIAALIAIVIVAAWPLLAGGITLLFASITFPSG